MEAFAGDGGMIPEQVWDTDDIPERGLYLRPALGLGHAAGLGPRRIPQAPPLALGRPRRSTRRRRRHNATWSRRSGLRFVIWRTDHRRRAIPAGKTLRIEVQEPADRAAGYATAGPAARSEPATPGWESTSPTSSPPICLRAVRSDFTFSWPESGSWERKNW